VSYLRRIQNRGNMPKLILRVEKFGATLYDTATLKHSFLSVDDKKRILEDIKRQGDDFQVWDANTNSLRDDIIYSPVRVYYELTLKCNLKCNLCFNSSGKPRNYEITTQEVLRSLEKLREANVIDIRFSGGEITQHPDWYEILKYAKNLGFVVSCNTNGVYKNKEVVGKLLALSLNQITVSVDGIKDGHERNRGKNNYNKTVNALQMLSEGKASIRINTLVSKWSIAQMEQIIELASLYAEEINFFPFRFLGRGLEQVDNSISMDEYYKMAQDAFSMRKKYPNLRILHFAQSFHSRSIDKDGHMGLKMGGPDGFTCLNITSDGMLWAGGYAPYIDPNCHVGNIITDNILDVWQENSNLDNYRTRSHRLKEICNNCSLYTEKCPGSIYELEHIRLLNPKIKNPFCVYGAGPSLLLENTSVRKLV
jgi:MoaA/NifB/PqqE/SkfB family radical SAM enzyme